MVRPREFDEDEVVRKAMTAFWESGYEATSLARLTEATGLVKGSLYKAFGDKKRLFMLALELYLGQGMDGLATVGASSATGREAIELILYGVAEAATASGLRCGCFAVNSAVELGPHDGETRNRLRRYTREKERTITALVDRGINDGSLRSDLDAEVVARTLVIVTDGIQAQGKLGLTRKQAKQSVESLLQGLV